MPQVSINSREMLGHADCFHYHLGETGGGDQGGKYDTHFVWEDHDDCNR